VINKKRQILSSSPNESYLLTGMGRETKTVLAQNEIDSISSGPQFLKNSRWQNGGLKHSYYCVSTNIMHNHTKFSCYMTWHLGFM
jgi:hypothetical protein